MGVGGTNVASLYALLGFKVDSGSLKTANKAVREFGSSTQSMLGTLTKGYLGLRAIQAVTSFGTGILSYTADIEMLTTQFEVMLGSADKAKNFMKEIIDVASVTPFRTKDLADGARLMMAFGMQVEDTIPLMMALGDITQGDKNRFNQFNLGFSQMIAANKLNGQDLKQMVDAGYNPLKSISEMKKITYDQAAGMMWRGEIKPSDVIAAIKRDTEKGGKFYEGMLKGGQTLPGLWSTVLDNINLVQLSLGEKLLPQLKELAKYTIQFLEKMREFAESSTWLNTMFDGINSAVKSIMSTILKGMTDMSGGASGVMDVIARGIAVVAHGLARLIGAFMWGVAPIVQYFSETALGADAIAESMSWADKVTLVIAGNLRTVADVLVDLIIFAKDFFKVLNAISYLIPPLLIARGLYAVYSSTKNNDVMPYMSETDSIKARRTKDLKDQIEGDKKSLEELPKTWSKFALAAPGGKGRYDKQKQEYEDRIKTNEEELREWSFIMPTKKNAALSMGYEDYMKADPFGLKKGAKSIRAEITNHITINAKPGGDGKTTLTPDALADAMDTMMTRSLFNVNLGRVINAAL